MWDDPLEGLSLEPGSPGRGHEGLSGGGNGGFLGQREGLEEAGQWTAVNLMSS